MQRRKEQKLPSYSLSIWSLKRTKTEAEEEAEDVLNIAQSAGIFTFVKDILLCYMLGVSSHWPFPAKKINKNCCLLSTRLAYFEASKKTKTEAEEEVEDVLNITQSAGISILLKLFYFALWVCGGLHFLLRKFKKIVVFSKYLHTYLFAFFNMYQYFVFGNKITSNYYVKIKILHIAESCYFQSSQQGQTDSLVVCDFRTSLES